MKKWIAPISGVVVVAALAVAGCKGVDWFPDPNANSTSTSSSSSSSSSTFTNTSTSTTTTASTFANQCAVTPNTEIMSNAIAVTGVTGLATITVSGGDSTFSINGTFMSGPALVGNGAEVVVRHNSGASGVVTSTLTIGGKTYTFITDTTGGSCS